MLTLLRHAHVYQPADLGVVDLLVGGGQILAIGALDDPPASWPGEVLDLEGHIVIPGLVDLHTHLPGGGGEGGAHTRVPPLGPSALLTAGVTTAVGLLGTDTTTRAMAELLATSRGLDPYGLTTFCYTGGYPVPPTTLTGAVRGDIVHIDRVIAVGETAISDHRSSQPTFEELVRLASDAYVSGLMTGKAGLLHLHLGDGPRGLALVRRALAETELPPRVFHPTHINRNRALWAEAMELAHSGLCFDITAFPDEPGVPTASADLAAWYHRGLPMERLTLSSDGGGCLPVFDDSGVLLHMEVGASASLLHAVAGAVAAGVPLAQALRPCTETAARHFRLAGKGRIEVGAHADLVVLDPDLRVDAVMTAGAWRVREGRAQVPGLFEPR